MSGLLNRNMRTATGVSAVTAPASRPAAGPAARRTVRYRTPTVATPMSAWGSSSDQLDSPNSRTESSMTHRDAGALSTVMAFAPSKEPKKNAVQLCEPACTAAE